MTQADQGEARALRRYALGILPDVERLALEERLIAEPDLFASLKLVEDDLIDAYVDHGLPAAERGQFERQLAEADDLRQRVAVWRLLKQQANATANERPATKAGLSHWLAARLEANPWLPGALAACLVVLVAGNIWFARTVGRLEEELRRASAAAPATGAHTSSIPTASSQASSLTLTLRPLLRSPESSTPRLTIPVGAQTIRLRLELPSLDYSRYSVSLVDQDGLDVLSTRNLTAEHDVHGNAVIVMLATEALPRGDYRVRLTGSQGPEGTGSNTGWRWTDVATYSIRLADPAPAKPPDHP
jgi:hypothetical protein